MGGELRSAEAREWRRLYATKQWAILRRQALTRDGFQCQRCGVILTDGRRSPRSAVVHHIEAHKGDMDLFFDLANLAAVCWACHSGAIQSEEVLGYDATIGADGWPVDPKHPGAK
jgi:5-methylcytosine-specific restriction enzyme A